MQEGLTAKALSTELKTGLAFLTRLPLAPDASTTGADISRASWTFPVIGAGIGALGGIVYWIAHGLGLPPFVCGTLAVGATVLITGALHEDGLADTADGFGGGTTQERKLEIMRDSRVGTYGALALILSFLLRAGAVASFTEPALAAAARRASPGNSKVRATAAWGRPPRRQAAAPLSVGATVALRPARTAPLPSDGPEQRPSRFLDRPCRTRALSG